MVCAAKTTAPRLRTNVSVVGFSSLLTTIRGTCCILVDILSRSSTSTPAPPGILISSTINQGTERSSATAKIASRPFGFKNGASNSLWKRESSAIKMLCMRKRDRTRSSPLEHSSAQTGIYVWMASLPWSVYLPRFHDREVKAYILPEQEPEDGHCYSCPPIRNLTPARKLAVSAGYPTTSL
jgi:hypothetical protein